MFYSQNENEFSIPTKVTFTFYKTDRESSSEVEHSFDNPIYDTEIPVQVRMGQNSNPIINLKADTQEARGLEQPEVIYDVCVTSGKDRFNT